MNGPWLEGLGPSAVCLCSSDVDRLLWLQSPRNGAQPGASPDLRRCAAALHKPVLPHLKSAAPGNIARRVTDNRISLQI